MPYKDLSVEEKLMRDYRYNKMQEKFKRQEKMKKLAQNAKRAVNEGLNTLNKRFTRASNKLGWKI